MKAIKTLILCFTIVVLASCTNDDHDYDDGKPYYTFTQNDREKLLILPTVGDTRVYQNQDGETITFTIQEAVQGKTTYSTGTFWGDWSEAHFHYDHQMVSMSYISGYPDTTSKVEMKRYPLGSNYQTQYPVEGTPTFFGNLDFPLWNGYQGTETFSNSIRINFNLSTLTMTFNGKTYDKINVFSSGRTEVLNANYVLPRRPRNVNKIYYDYHFGVVGFDDLDGKQWRLL